MKRGKTGKKGRKGRKRKMGKERGERGKKEENRRKKEGNKGAGVCVCLSGRGPQGEMEMYAGCPVDNSRRNI